MEIWMVQNGVRTGPFAPYDIEGRITRGELEAAQPAWHDGMAVWGTLGEMPAFAAVFARAEAAEVQQAVEHEERQLPPLLPAKPLLIRRFLARWFDLSLVNLLWWGGLFLTGQNLKAVLLNPWLMLAPLVPIVLLEPWLLRRLGTTPGKALLGLWVANLDGSRLTLRQGTIRTVRVLSLGVGLTLPYLAFACQALSAWLTWRMGSALWDLAPGHRVHERTPKVWQSILFGVIFLGILQATGTIMMPTYLEVMPPWLRSLVEQTQR